jgi:hypothetical protein
LILPYDDLFVSKLSAEVISLRELNAAAVSCLPDLMPAAVSVVQGQTMFSESGAKGIDDSEV